MTHNEIMQPLNFMVKTYGFWFEEIERPAAPRFQIPNFGHKDFGPLKNEKSLPPQAFFSVSFSTNLVIRCGRNIKKISGSLSSSVKK